MFVGRERELEKLEQLYAREQFQFAVVYGRRRVGKTTLINKFTEDKAENVIYFTGVEENEKDNLARFSKAVGLYLDANSEVISSFSSFEDVFQRIGELSKDKQLIVVIDEYPYLAQSYPAISSILQSYIDHQYLQSKLFLILCGSSMSFMENQVLGYKSPLYGRRTTQMKIQPFTFDETKMYLSGMDKETIFTLFAVTGGIPQYLRFMSKTKTLQENIVDAFLSPVAPLFEEPSNLLKQELREPANYNSIIHAIAQGSSKQNEIATKTGIPNTSITKYLTNLTDLGIVEKVVPITEIDRPRTRRTLYRITDDMFRFWYAFVGPNVDYIERGYEDQAWKLIEKGLPRFLGAAFEKLSLNYLWENMLNQKIVPVPFQRLGTWWGTDNQQRREVEIDLLGYSSDKQIGFFGECKWRNEFVSRDVLERLVHHSNLFPYLKKEYYLFAKKGFTPECHRLAAEVNAHLILFEDM